MPFFLEWECAIRCSVKFYFFGLYFYGLSLSLRFYQNAFYTHTCTGGNQLKYIVGYFTNFYNSLYIMYDRAIINSKEDNLLAFSFGAHPAHYFYFFIVVGRC